MSIKKKPLHWFSPSRWIPERVPARCVLFGMKIAQLSTFWMRKAGRNAKAYGSLPDEFIENQNEFERMPYGKTSLAYAGCGIIAVWNVLHAYREAPKKELIPYFERHGAVAGGKLGTHPWAIEHFLRSEGFTVKRFYRMEPCMVEASYILMVYNDGRDIRKQMHIFAVTRGDNCWEAHNINGSKVCADELCQILEGVNDGKSKLIMGIEVKGRERVRVI